VSLGYPITCIFRLTAVGRMAKYACFFVNAAERFDGVEPIEAATDADAITYAKKLLHRAHQTAAVEVWHQAKLIGRVDRERS
jgi:hypothetical protein